MRVPAKPEDIVEIYLDESSQNSHKYLVLGAVVTPLVERPKLEKLIAEARLPQMPDREAKWSRVSLAKLSAYKRIVDTLFDNTDLAHFHSLFVDTSKINNARFNAGDREIGFNKEIYQLALKISKLYADALFHLYPDQRQTNQQTSDLRLILNRGWVLACFSLDWPKLILRVA